MSEMNEGRREAGQIRGVLRDGLENLDLNQEVTFQSYTRVVLPIDGYVFWAPKVPITIKGSLHFSQEIQQNEDELFGQATVLFTSEKHVTQFSTALDTIYVATMGDFRYAFSQQQGFYKQADLWHYFGHSITPALQSQLLDTPGAIDPTRAVTSNSLALWLSLNSYVNPYFPEYRVKGLTLFPSFLTTPNLVPPYGSVQIGENDTTALQSLPLIDVNGNHTQLVSDKVKIILYGLQHDEAMDFVDFVLQYSLNTENFGIMNMPVIRDGNRVQSELQAKAMQKSIEFEISYYQTRVRNVARKLILAALPTYIIRSVP